MVRVGFPGGPRLEWYDRNPQSITFTFYAEDTAPHSTTIRWSYTVPTGKKFYVENAMAFQLRGVAATTLGRSYVRVVARDVSVLHAQMERNEVGDSVHLNVGRGCLVQAGEEVRGITMDEGEGGTIDMGASMHGVEFNA